jgi:zeaxanthin glucosyltransferase
VVITRCFLLIQRLEEGTILNVSHVAISCPPLPGHINPFCVLGRKLVQRGHQVTLFSMLDAEPMVRGQGIRFSPLAVEQAPAGTLTPLFDSLKRQQGLKATLFVIQAATRILELLLADAPNQLQKERVDVVLADQNEPALASVAEHLHLPFASICTSLPINREAAIPPSFTGWNYGTGLLATLRNRIGYTVSDYLTRNLQATLNKFRKRWELPILSSPDDSFSKAAQIAQMPAEFDFPRRALPQTMFYTGPWLDETFDDLYSGPEFPNERLDGRPVLYASLGTLQSSDSRFFEMIAEACLGLDLQLVMAVASKKGTPLPTLPGNHLVVRFAPQLRVLKSSALCITHAGMNTTMQALSFGTPLIAIPLAHDQPAIAARLKRTGAGIVMSPRDVTSRKLRTAIEMILEKDSPWQVHAKRMQREIIQSGGADRAADILEEKVFTQQSQTAST